jgi:ParE toxin of type II toxin-antitoxin system, parDE
MRCVSYRLDIAPDAESDLDRLIESLPAARRSRALASVMEAMLALAVNPRLSAKSSRTLGRPTYRLHFVVDDVHYDWAATFCYSQDEEAVVVTHMYRQAL